jgi:hypothetical protein
METILKKMSLHNGSNLIQKSVTGKDEIGYYVLEMENHHAIFIPSDPHILLELAQDLIEFAKNNIV